MIGIFISGKTYCSNAERLHEATVIGGCDAITKLLPPATQFDREEEDESFSFSPSFSLGEPRSRIIENHLNGFLEYRNEKPQAKAWGE
jgi:hypothetical protein